ncbi:hypothetical protein F5883DRAFT_185092 [Diaporthe sp. PMI_573]|nr:hypothetical protein F5883DRAFT_185092 [Diaporthaceae sp. PMI_573]
MPMFNASQRELGWNVRILLNARITTSLAGFYQKDDFVTVGNVRRELDLCFQLDDDNGQRQPALISARSSGGVIILDKNDSAPFPTPLPNTKSNYYLISHDPMGSSSYKMGRQTHWNHNRVRHRNIAQNVQILICPQAILTPINLPLTSRQKQMIFLLPFFVIIFRLVLEAGLDSRH